MNQDPGKIILEEVTDPAAIAKFRERWERADRNWAWFEARAAAIYDAHRGKSICVAGQELFVADSSTEALRLATAAHPEDDGRFLLYIPREKRERIYGPFRAVAALP